MPGMATGGTGKGPISHADGAVVENSFGYCQTGFFWYDRYLIRSDNQSEVIPFASQGKAGLAKEGESFMDIPLQQDLSSETVSPERHGRALWSWILFPGIAVMLGWGLRGYIGGGPFAAMIPGAFLAMSLSLLLGHGRKTAALVALFGAVGIGYGGEMTYGQTLGLACNPDTMSWGLLGTTVKGAIWGLLGGAVLGAGLTSGQYSKRSLLLAFLLTLVSFFVGWKLINEPRLIYFSDPVNSPRDESWAGLLFSAVAFLAFLYGRGDAVLRRVPLRFALWGALGGGIGFGGGTLFLVYGPELPVPQAWFGWWKAMEFFFGLLLGAALGFCAWRNRDLLKQASAVEIRDISSLPHIVGLVALVVVFFLAFPALERFLDVGGEGPSGSAEILAYNLLRPLYTFVFFGAVCVALGLYSAAAAWQTAITITFFHVVYDFNRNMPATLNLEAPLWLQGVILAVASVSLGAYVLWRRNRPGAVASLYKVLLWACFIMATVKSFVRAEVIHNGPGEIFRHPSTLTMYATFVVTAVITAWYIRKLSGPEVPEEEP